MPRSPRTIGPYRILKPLGEGGMGVVYHAKHAETGSAVALKTIRVPHAGMLGSIRREIHALARLDHPGIVSFLDEGVEDGTPWYAMELLQNWSLRQVIQLGRWDGADPANGATPAESPTWLSSFTRAPTSVMGPRDPAREECEGSDPRGPDLAESLPRILTVVRRLCSPLAYLHGEGIVHRDLKPDNIVIRANGLPVLVDFGLVNRFGGVVSRDAFEVGGLVSGTWAYMPPEQARGEVVDARADLYALGCILYELLSGRPPFGFGEGSRLMRAHASEPPPPIAGLPAPLAELLARLLTKDPSQRLGHALDVAAVLESLGAEDGIGGPRPRPYLYRPLLAGRSDAMSQLQRFLDAVREGEGRLVLIGGESGVGKTRLATELAKRAQRNGTDVLVGECDEHHRGGLRAFMRPLQAVGDRCREMGLRETERIFGRRGKVLAVSDPSLRDLPGQHAYPEPAELPAVAAAARLFSYLSETLRAIAPGRPLLLVLDDLQWADELTTSFLEFLAGIGPIPWVLIVGTYRTEERSEALSRLESSAEVQCCRLGRLDARAVGTMVKEMLALADPPGEFTDYLHERSEGVPFFVAEYLRVAIAEGVLFRGDDGAWRVETETGESTLQGYRALPLPASLEELVARRLDGLSERQLGLVTLAAALGREMPAALLQQAMNCSEIELLGVLEDLRTRQLFDLNQDAVTFSHDRIREVAYRRVPEDDLPTLHRTAAHAIESRYGSDSVAHQPELGRHWSRAGEPDRARPCYLSAARTAGSQFAHRQAEQLYRGYLALVTEPTEESIVARNELAGNVLDRQGHVEDVEALYRQSVEEAIQMGSEIAEARSLLGLGGLCLDQGRLEEGQVVLEKAFRLFHETGDASNEGRTLVSLAGLKWHQGQMEEARAMVEQAIAIARADGDRISEASALGNLATLHKDQGRLEEAREHYEASLAAFRELKERVFEGMILSNLAILHRNRGDLIESRKMSEQALILTREVGDRYGEAVALGGLATIHRLQGRPEEARPLYLQCLAIAREVGDRRNQADTLGNLGRLEMEQGRLDEAGRHFERGLSLSREAKSLGFEGSALVNLGQLAARRGRSGEAQQLFEEALAIQQKIGDRQGEAETLEELSQLHDAEGRADRARECRERASVVRRDLKGGKSRLPTHRST